MANTAKKSKTESIFKLLAAFSVLVFLWLFINDSTYSLIKKQFVKNADTYIEMYAYTKSKPSFTEKYFIVQNNERAESFFKNEVSVVSENDIDTIECSNEEILLIYEKKSDVIDSFVSEKQGVELTLNKGTDIEFYTAKIDNRGETCNIGG